MPGAGDNLPDGCPHLPRGRRQAMIDAYVATHPSAVASAPRAESGLGRLVLVALLAAAACAAYRLLS